MNENIEGVVVDVCGAYGKSRSRMLDIVCEIQARLGSVPRAAFGLIARETGASRVEVESVVSFYAFLADRPKGKVVVRLCDDIVDEMMGAREVQEAFEEELGIKVGETTSDGTIHLEHTPCIGMSDQAPAALVNDVVMTSLTPEKARQIAAVLKSDPDPAKLVTEFGDGNNANDLVKAMVKNNIQQAGEVLFAEFEKGCAIEKLMSMKPEDVVTAVKTSKLRGRGGAGFPTGMKWEFTLKTGDEEKYLICNADEGEPGTFKDRVLLTERADLLFEGMTIAGYAIGARTGILYLRAEYAYLRAFLEDVLSKRRDAGLLGSSVAGVDGFEFDIRIQMGAGAYICGEETALISSCEGGRGDPKNRPPFPAQKGYLGKPTCVNNVETLCCVPWIVCRGPAWFANIGTMHQFTRDTAPIPAAAIEAAKHSAAGTKLLSVSGDVSKPGVYEITLGITVGDFLALCGGTEAAAVQIGGPSGQMIGPDQFGRAISFDDLATGGSIIVFGKERNLLEVVAKFLDFFIDESCGFCTPCRAGNVLMRRYLHDIMDGKADSSDLENLEQLAKTVKATSRCGLGQTSPNPVLTTLQNFRLVYNAMIKEPVDGKRLTFDLASAVGDAEKIAGRKSVHN